MVAPQDFIAVSAQAAGDMYGQLLSEQRRFILDVRNEEDFKRWRVEGRRSLRVLNVPYFNFLEDEAGSLASLPAGQADILVVCAKEGSSQFVAEILQASGRQASYLQGGIRSWGHFYDIRDVVAEPFGRIIQIARPARGDVSFVVLSDGQAAVIDPLRAIEHYTGVIKAAGAVTSLILDTHAHADHLSGGPALARATGAPYYLHPYDAIHPLDMLPARLDYRPLADGQEFRLGQFTVRTIWFPGHTLGQVNFLFTAPAGQTYLFSGDGLFLGSFGRPDLGGRAESWTPLLYDSLFDRLPGAISDDTLILPAHFGTLDEGGEAGRFAAPYGLLKKHNEGLQARSRTDFSTYVLSHLPTFPSEYVEIKRVNIGLTTPDETKAEELELGKNLCAMAE